MANDWGTISYDLEVKAEPHWSVAPIHLTPVSQTLPDIVLSVSPTIRLEGLQTAKTPFYRGLKSLSLILLPQGFIMDGWQLKSLLLIQVISDRQKTLVSSWLAGVVEYGTGPSEDVAVNDLINSIGEYRQVLKKRKDSLTRSARKELAYLNKLIKRATKREIELGLPGTA